MQVKLFLEYLPWLREPDYKAQVKNLSHQYIEWQIRGTTPLPRQEPLVFDADTPAEIIELFRDKDLSCINMLWTSFLGKPNRVLEGWHFATMSETMIVQTLSGRIEAYNLHPIRAIHGDSQFLGVLAKDMESYLEALLCGAMIGKHFSPGFADEPGVKEKLEPIAKLCSVIAGGDEYHDFWAGVLGL